MFGVQEDTFHLNGHGRDRDGRKIKEILIVYIERNDLSLLTYHNTKNLL